MGNLSVVGAVSKYGNIQYSPDTTFVYMLVSRNSLFIYSYQHEPDDLRYRLDEFRISELFTI